MIGIYASQGLTTITSERKQFIYLHTPLLVYCKPLQYIPLNYIYSENESQI